MDGWMVLMLILLEETLVHNDRKLTPPYCAFHYTWQVDIKKTCVLRHNAFKKMWSQLKITLNKVN